MTQDLSTTHQGIEHLHIVFQSSKVNLVLHSPLDLRDVLVIRLGLPGVVPTRYHLDSLVPELSTSLVSTMDDEGVRMELTL
jgi:hypothetical protein